MVAGSGEKTLVWRYTETVDLRVWMLNGARANSRQCFPETNGKATLARRGSSTELMQLQNWSVPNCVIVSSCHKDTHLISRFPTVVCHFEDNREWRGDGC